MIQLRVLKEKDAELMLEWMRDPEIQKCYQKNMAQISLEDACEFCRRAFHEEVLLDAVSMHYAVVDETDEYLGTISLKNINLKNATAEYAISTRRCAQGKGIAREATYLLLKKAFKQFRLHKVYLNVLSDNEHANRFYEKCGFRYEGQFREHLKIGEQYKSLNWYSMINTEFDENRF